MSYPLRVTIELTEDGLSTAREQYGFALPYSAEGDAIFSFILQRNSNGSLSVIEECSRSVDAMPSEDHLRLFLTMYCMQKLYHNNAVTDDVRKRFAELLQAIGWLA